MSDDPKDIEDWKALPSEERIAIRRAAQSQIWWAQTSKKIRGTGPFLTTILGALALWQIFGEWLKEWLTK